MSIAPAVPNTYAAHFWRLIVLALPVIAAQLLNQAIAVTDVAMVGRLGSLALAQVGLGSQFIFLIQITVVGFLIALGPIAAQAAGAGDETVVRRALRMAIWQSIAFGVIAIALAYGADPILTALNQPPEVVVGAVQYIKIAAWGYIPVFIAVALQNYLVAFDRNNAYLAVSLLGFFANLAGDYALIFGHFGAPALGLQGAAWATVLTRIALMIGAFVIVVRIMPKTQPDLFKNFWRFDRVIFLRLLRIGAPISAGILSEVGMFQFATIMMGWIGVIAQAAHTVVLNVVSTAFMVPLGFSIVASVRAGNALGRQDRIAFVLGARVAMMIVLGFMALSAMMFWLVPAPFINAFLDRAREDSAGVLAAAIGLLAVGAVFQLVDGVQVVVMGVLRGVQDTFWPATIAFFCYWGLGVPLGYVLAFSFGLGGVGVWAGLATGLGFAALFLSLRLARVASPSGFARTARVMAA